MREDEVGRNTDKNIRFLVASMNNIKITLEPHTDLKTKASFVFLPQKFCGNPAGNSRKNFVILMGLPTFYLDS